MTGRRFSGESRTIDSGRSISALRTTATPRELSGMKLGRYYALVIGNHNYQNIEPLQTPLNDARRAAQLLKDKYAFSVTVINDADDIAMPALRVMGVKQAIGCRSIRTRRRKRPSGFRTSRSPLTLHAWRRGRIFDRCPSSK